MIHMHCTDTNLEALRCSPLVMMIVLSLFGTKRTKDRVNIYLYFSLHRRKGEEKEQVDKAEEREGEETG